MSKKFDIKIFTINRSACTSILDTSYNNALVGPKMYAKSCLQYNKKSNWKINLFVKIEFGYFFTRISL